MVLASQSLRNMTMRIIPEDWSTGTVTSKGPFKSFV